jgi:hypothetical protein
MGRRVTGCGFISSLKRMPVDPDYLRQHYASLSDEALLAIDRADLVEQARGYFDEEVGKRSVASRHVERPKADSVSHGRGAAEGDKPDWLDETSEVFSEPDIPGKMSGDQIANARDVLEAAGIPCHLEACEIPKREKSSYPPPTHMWRLMVPSSENLLAASVLDRDIYNDEFEAVWKSHLEMLSDDELGETDPKTVFCGLFDRVERVSRAYGEEVRRRGLK